MAEIGQEMPDGLYLMSFTTHLRDAGVLDIAEGETTAEWIVARTLRTNTRPAEILRSLVKEHPEQHLVWRTKERLAGRWHDYT